MKTIRHLAWRGGTTVGKSVSSRGGRTPELRSLTRNALRRNPVTAVVLVVFVALSTMLAASAGAIILTATGAAGSLMEAAKAPHFMQMHTGPVDGQRLAAFADGHADVESWALVPMLNVDGARIRVSGEGTDTTLAAGLQDNSFVAQNPDFDHLLDTRGEVITPEPGTVWLPLYYATELDLQGGQTLTVTAPGATPELRVAGFLRDSQMNSSFASSKRLLVAQEDLDRLTTAMGEAAGIEHLIEFRLTSTDAIGPFETDYREAGLEANGPALSWTLFLLANSLSEGILAGLVILVALLLVAIALLCVRFTLLTTLEQDYREIGVLKGIGVRDRDVRRLYLHRYAALAVLGAAVGLVASLGLSHLLLAPTRQLTGASGNPFLSLLLGLVLAALVVGVVVLAVRDTLRRTTLVSPVQAIRSGAATTGRSAQRRFPRWLSVDESRLDTGIVLGLRGLLGRPGLYVVPLVIFTLASFILAVPQSLWTTATHRDFVTYMGIGVSDLRAGLSQSSDPDRDREFTADLAQDPRVEASTLLTTAAYTASDPAGKAVTVKVESGDLATFPVRYQDGSAPSTDAEISLSQLQADTLGAEVGDVISLVPVVPVEGEAAPLELTVTGLYQDISNGGKTAKMTGAHTSGEVMWKVVYADFEDGVVVEEAIEDYASANPDLKIGPVQSYVETILGGLTRALASAAVISTAVGLAVAALVTGLFMRMLMARDAFAIAVQRALGVRDGVIQRQYVVRGVLVLIAGVVLGTVLAALTGGALAGAALSPLGLSQLSLVTNPWLAYVLSPLALLAVVTAATLASTRPAQGAPISSTIKE